MEDDDDQSTCIEPVISYCSPSTNRGVKEISNKKINLIKNTNNDFSYYNTYRTSLNNTIMLPFISSDGSIQTENSNKNIIKQPNQISKENSSNNYYIKFDNTRNKTISSRSDYEQKNYVSLDLKITNTYNDVTSNIIKKGTFVPKRFSMNLPETNYQEMLNYKSNNTEHNYESDNPRNYNKKYTVDIKDSIRTTKTKHTHIMEERIPSLFLRAGKNDKKTNKNIIVFKNKKRRKTQKVISKNNKLITPKKKDKPDMFFLEKSKSYSNESLQRHIQSSYKKNKLNNNNNNIIEAKLSKQICKSNKSLKELKGKINNDDSIKKNWTIKGATVDKYKSNIKIERKKKKKTDKNDRKISFKENNINNQLVKIMFSRNNEIKNNKYESSGLAMLRDQMNNRKYKEKKEEEKFKRDKSKKIIKKTSNSKDKETDKNELNDSKKQEDRRPSGFLSKEEVIKKIFNRPSNKEKKLTRREKTKNFDNNNNNDSKKDMNKIKSTEISKNDSNNNLFNPISRRKRSISLHYQNDKIHQISEAIRAKIPKRGLNLNNSPSSTVIPKRKKKKKLSDVEVLLKKNLKDEQYNLFSKFTNTTDSGPDFTKYIISCIELIMDMDKDSQVRLKTKINFNFPKGKKKIIKKRIALFDLDETLVHCTGDVNSVKKDHQHEIDIRLPGKNSVKVGINLRPLWKETLDLVKKKYHIVIHTASHQAYADAVLDFMDPEKKYFKYRLYRNNCSLVDIDGVKFYVKDLDIFDEYYDLKDIVIIDNSVLSFAYHLYNGIPIVPYYEGNNDNFLYIVGLYLEHIYKANDLREANKKLINLDYFFDIANAQEENADNVIDEESKVIEEDEENSQTEIKEENKTSKKGDETNKSKKSRHKSGKSAYTNKKMNSGSNSPLSARRTIKELSENKLMNNSNLFNMYLEFNDKKNLKINKFSLTSKETKKEKSLNIINFSNYAKLVREDINTINKESDDKDIDSKSQPEINHPTFEIDIFSDDDSSVKNKRLKRVMSLVDGEFLAKKIKDAIMGNLEILKTNFSNKFKDLEKINEND